MKTFSLSQISVALFLLAFSSPTLHALPVDLSIPPSTLGAASDQGYATHWIEMAELDFGQGLSLPVRLGFLSGRSSASVNFGSMPWRSPLLNSRIYDRSASSWSLLLPCGRVMTLVPQTNKPDQWGTADGEWTVSMKDKNTLVSRADGWEMEFDKDDRLIRLRTDAGRQVVWNRDPNGNAITLVEQPQDPKKPATLGFTVRRDPTSKLITSFTYLTAVGQKVYNLGFDAERRLTKVTFPDSTAHQISYSATPEGHPSMTVVGRDLISTALTWHKDNRTLLSDGVWTYQIQPQAKNNPIMTRTGPHGEFEIHHDDQIKAQTLFTAADGTQTIKQKVKNGAAKGKLQSITRIPSRSGALAALSGASGAPAAGSSKESGTGLQPVVPDSKNQEPGTNNQEQVLYSAKYDPRNLLTEETDAMGRITKHTYVLHGSNIHLGIKTHTTSQPIPAASDKSVESAKSVDKSIEEFDRRGNLIASTDAHGHTIRHVYDAQNRRLKTTGPDGTVLETLTHTPQNRIATRTDAVGAITRYTYNKEGHRGSITDALGHMTTEEHNAQGLLTKTTDPLGRTTTNEYDQGGRLIQQTAAHGTPIAATTLYTYDNQGRRLTATDPAGLTTAQTYDKLGRITSRTDALSQTTKYEYSVKRGSTGCISCSASGLPTRIISPSGRITERVYDADRHLIEETIAAGTQEAATTKHTYDLAGNLLTSTDPLGRTTAHAYDAQNNKVKTTHPDGSSKTFAYNALGQLTAETNELGHTTKRAYDLYGNLIALTTPEGHITHSEFTAPTKNNELGPRTAGLLLCTAPPPS
ncbi:MAG: hypothetical protein NTV80_08310 [Verrucomicrobia bacterium]|nr:hypothetical protein [Verrucomicrobiota bacterium]